MPRFDGLVAKRIPEYAQFLTGQVEERTAVIANQPGEQRIKILEEAKKGGLGDVVETYVSLLMEEREHGWWKRLFSFRQSCDRQYVLKQLKDALNTCQVKW
jgi:hypothetical protein